MTPPPAPPPKPPLRRPESTTTVIIEETPSNFWKVLVFIVLLGFLGTAIFLHLKNEPPEIATAPPATGELRNLADPTGRPAEEIIPEEIGEPLIEAPLPPSQPAVVLNELSSFNDRSSLAELQQATRQRFSDGLWEEHFARVQQAALAALRSRPATTGARQLDALIQRQTLPLALAQIEIHNRLRHETFLRWVAASPDFAAELLTDPARSALLVNNLAPEDSLPYVLSIWEQLEEETAQPRLKNKYLNLNLALALVFDKDNRLSEARAAQRYYLDADRKHNLYVDFSKISPDELVFGIATPVFGIAGMEWALKNFSFSEKDLGKAYSRVPYRLNHPAYPEYTIENILKLGGVCVQQADVSHANARARGIPAVGLGGTGSRGGHAWFAYRKSDGTWDNSTGRYNDGYACGTTSNPQTGKTMREWDLFLFNDPGRRNGSYQAAQTIIRAANLLASVDDSAGQLVLLEAAAGRNSSHPASWYPYLKTLRDDNTERPIEFWNNLVRSYRRDIKDFPDHFAIAEELEIQKIFPLQNPEQVAILLRNRRREIFRKHPERFDLIVGSVKREIAYYRTTNDTNRIGHLYRNTFEDVGTHLPTFMAVADQFALDAETYPDLRRRTLSTMEKVFNKEIDSNLKGDLFRLGMEAGVCQKLASLFDGENEKRKANRYTERAALIRETAEKKRADA